MQQYRIRSLSAVDLFPVGDFLLSSLVYFIRIYIFILYAVSVIRGQNVFLTGTVTDGESGKPIDNVNISASPSGTGTQTNWKGEFQFSLVSADSILTVQHIGYETLKLQIHEFENGTVLGLRPRIIEFQEVGITGTSRQEFLPFETENSVIELSAQELTIRSFVDVGDALFSEQSVVVNESISGQKTMSIRGAAAEEMVYMYDGVRINTMGDPLFDLSVFNVSGISGLEMVRGAHERALSSSGTVNFIPKLSYGSDASFVQRLGTYNSGSWAGVGSIGNSMIGLTGGLGESESAQVYEGQAEPQVKGSNNNHFLHFGMQKNNRYELRILGLKNSRQNLNIKTQDSLGLDFHTWIGKLNASHPNGGFLSFYFLSQVQDGFANSTLYRSDKNGRNQGYGLQFHYPILAAQLNLEAVKNDLNAAWDTSLGRINAQRSLSILTGSFELLAKNAPSRFQLQNIKIVFSRKTIQDEHGKEDTILNTDVNWREKGSQFTLSFLGPYADKRIFLYGNLGASFRMPSLQERFSSQLQPPGIQQGALVPEHKYTREAGVKLEGGASPRDLDYTMALALFSYNYDDKIKQVQYSSSSIRFPINYGRAAMSGLDANLQFWSPKRSFHTLVSYAFYHFSDQIAFPLQPVKMIRGKFLYTWKGLTVEWVVRSESSRIWTTISREGEYFDNRLEPMMTYDAYTSYRFMVRSIRISIGISGRNLANNAQVLEGISIYDRRAYVTTEVQWN